MFAFAATGTITSFYIAAEVETGVSAAMNRSFSDTLPHEFLFMQTKYLLTPFAFCV